MPPKDESLTVRVSSAYKQLSSAATELNTVSDELGKFVGALDTALKRLNLGISTWIRLDSREDGLGNYTKRDLGYAKVGGRWGISLRTMAGNHNTPDISTVEEWLFNDAPRALRIEAIEKLPDLFDALIKDAETATAQIRSRTSQAQHLAHILTEITSHQPMKKTDL
ncbi:MAG: hypothetical protein ABL961_03960 [Vicinamibacterales bacterium]